MGADEEDTLERLKALRRQLLDPKIAEHHGRVVKTTGDGLLVEFASVVDAVRCAVAVQQAMPARNIGIDADSRIEWRIGINLGDVIVEGGDLYSVIARNSSFTYKGQAIDVKQVGRELGVRYVLEGSVRKAGGRVRITAQLIDASNGAHLWADRFDGLLEDVFDLQDRVAVSVAGVIEPTLQAAETARSANRPTDDLTAYDLYLRAYAMLMSSASQVAEALRLACSANPVLLLLSL